MISKNRIKIIQGDITAAAVDAIVNAANSSLLGGGGVDGAIHGAAGPELLQACKKLGGCPTGGVRITPGFNLSAKYVFHTVGPVWDGGTKGEAELLKSCYVNCFKKALENNIATIAFPAISAGIFGYPMEAAAQIALENAKRFIQQNDTPLKMYFYCYNETALSAYTNIFKGLWK